MLMMIALALDGWIAAFPKSGTGPLSGQNKQHQFVNIIGQRLELLLIIIPIIN